MGHFATPLLLKNYHFNDIIELYHWNDSFLKEGTI